MKTYTVKDRLACLFRKEWLVVLPVYCLGLIPATVLAAFVCRWLDGRLGFHPLPPAPYNLIGAVVLFLLGGALLFWSYTYLILEGEGGPIPPFSSTTKHLVTCGPYRVVRHPSIIAKLLGVIGLGLLFQSPTFLFILIPILLGFSIWLNIIIQEKIAIERLGQPYLDYKKRVPMLIPYLWK